MKPARPRWSSTYAFQLCQCRCQSASEVRWKQPHTNPIYCIWYIITIHNDTHTNRVWSWALWPQHASQGQDATKLFKKSTLMMQLNDCWQWKAAGPRLQDWIHECPRINLCLRKGRVNKNWLERTLLLLIPPAPTPRLPAEYWFFFTSTSLPFSKWKCQLRDPQSVVRRFWGQNEVNAISSFSPRRFASFWNDNLGKYVAGFRVAQAEEKLCLLQAYYCDSRCMENSSIHFALVQCHLWTCALFKFLSCRPSQGILSCRWGNRMIANLEIVISDQPKKYPGSDFWSFNKPIYIYLWIMNRNYEHISRWLR